MPDQSVAQIIEILEWEGYSNIRCSGGWFILIIGNSIDQMDGTYLFRDWHTPDLHKAYSAESKGKGDRFNCVIDSFISEVVIEKPTSLNCLNELFQDWLIEFLSEKITFRTW